MGKDHGPLEGLSSVFTWKDQGKPQKHWVGHYPIWSWNHVPLCFKLYIVLQGKLHSLILSQLHFTVLEFAGHI
jgi:hypothetical protein